MRKGGAARDQWTSVPSWPITGTLRSSPLSPPPPSMSLKYTTFSLRESCISFLVPAWHFHMCSILPVSQARNPGVFGLFTVFTCFLVALRWLLGWCQESSPTACSYFFWGHFPNISSLCMLRGTPSFNPTFQNSSSLTWSITIIYFPIIYLLTKYLGWAFSQSKLGASVAVACGLSSCGSRGLDSRHMGLSTGMCGSSRPGVQTTSFVLAGRLSTLDHPRSPPITILYQLISLAYLIASPHSH